MGLKQEWGNFDLGILEFSIYNIPMKLPFTVIMLGLVSFFNDFASEMIYPLVPIFLTTQLNMSVSIIGVIEGIAEATASLSKFGFGVLSDYLGKRKIFVTFGYVFATFYKILIGISYAWPMVLFARFFNRLGKGLRTAARDSMLLENADMKNKGMIFGFHRAADSAGAVLGSLSALIFLIFLPNQFRLIFFLSIIPSVIGIILLIAFVKERKTVKVEQKYSFKKLSWKAIDPKLKLFLLVNFLFSVGNSSDTFLILNAQNLGMATTLTLGVYILFSLFQTVFSTPAGQWADKIGAKKVFIIGLLVFAIVYLLFGMVKNPFWLWFIFPMYGIYNAFTDGVSKSYVSEFITKDYSGSFFGLFYTLTAVGNLLASSIGGLLWTAIHPSATFYFGSGMAIIALILFMGAEIVIPSKVK
jgi:MFS family permease